LFLHCWFGHVACKIVSEKTYYICVGWALNLTHLLHLLAVRLHCVDARQ